MTQFWTQWCISFYWFVSNSCIHNICAHTGSSICRQIAIHVDEPCHKDSDHFFLFDSECHVVWNQTSLCELYEVLLHNFLFQPLLFRWWKVDVCWPIIIFFITPINHTDVMTGIQKLKVWAISCVVLWVEMNSSRLYIILNWYVLYFHHFHNIRN